MRRPVASLAALLCALVLPASSAAASPAPVHGTIISVGAQTLTVQTGGRMVGVINALTSAADALAARHLAYVWGGGHAEAGIAGAMVVRHHGHQRRQTGFDCSGSVAAVLAAARLWTPGSPVPNDAGLVRQLLAEHLLARGAGSAPAEVNLYDDPGIHIFMSIDGRFFGTSDGGAGNPNPAGGPAWLDDGAPDATSHQYRRYHFLPSVLHNRTSYGHDYTFVFADPTLTTGAESGDGATVSYTATNSGAMDAVGLVYDGAQTVTGTVTALAPDGSSLTLQPATGAPLTLTTTLSPELLSGLAVGATIQVTYSGDPAGALVPHALAVTAAAPAPLPSAG